MPLPRLGVELNSLCRALFASARRGPETRRFLKTGGLNDLPIHLASGFG